MKYPSTISVSEDTFRRLLTDIAASLKAHGFRHIILIGDSGGNQAGMKAVAVELSGRWKGSGVSIHFIPEYYDYPGVMKWLASQGVPQSDEGIHDDFAITSQMMVVDPATVRMRQRLAKGKFSINGVNLAPAEKSIEWGKKVVNYRADIAVAAIRKALAN